MEGKLFLFVVLLFCAGCFIVAGCHNSTPAVTGTTVVLNVSTAHNKQAFIERLPYYNEKIATLDSALVVTMTDSIVFHIPLEADQMYRIKISGSRFAFNFIPDAPYIHINANNANGRYTVEGSPATTSLKTFIDGQAVLNSGIQNIVAQLDSLNKTGSNAQVRVLMARRDSLVKALQANNILYADTVSNAAAFIQAFSTIEYGNNVAGLQTLVDKAAKRFPTSKAVQMIRQDALDMVSIYTQEYNVGDSLPSISLPDVNGQVFNTASLRGKFYLLDFWATWYPKTLGINDIKKQVTKAYPAQKLQLVSVALDDNKGDWTNMIHNQNLNWVQLIDEDMWHGTAAKTLKFDSIPFNFLVNDKGRIIAKAIKPDSMMYVLQKAIR